jgi:thermitase
MTTLPKLVAALLLLPLTAAFALPLAAPAAAAGALGEEPTEPTFAPGAAVSAQSVGRRLLVQVEVDADPAEVDAALAAAGGQVVERIDELDVLVVDVAGAPEPVIARLDASPAIVHAEPDLAVQAVGRTPNDPIYPDQWSLPRINAPAAWTTSTGSSQVTIAVLDTGVDAGHEDLRGAVIGGHDFVDRDADPDDEHGHGTMSAGVAAARTDNLRGMAGVCWTCSVLAVRVLDDAGQGTVGDVIAGIRYAADAGADIITLSLGSPTASNALALAVDYAADKGALIVASAGNFGREPHATQPVYPAAYANVVGVAGSNAEDRRYDWSSHGGWVALAAPGCNVATRPGLPSYGWYCGTSSAAPVVAGVAGLALAKYPTATSTQLRAALEGSATAVPFVAHGRVDAAGTLDALERAGLPSAPAVGDSGQPTDPGDAVSPVRHAGENRYDTAARAVRATFSGPVERAYVATGDDFPDALAAGPVAAAAGGPVLLTAPGALPEVTAAALTELAPADIVVVGGRSAVADAVLAEIRAATGVQPRRVHGADRYETAAQVAREAFPDGADVAYVATGENFADALAGTPAAAVDDAPMLLTAQARLPGATRDALRALQPATVIVLGGTGAVANAVLDDIESAIAVRPRRVSGSDRYETAAKVAARAFPDRAQVNVLATGANFPDALVGGPVAAHLRGPLLLVRTDVLPPVAAEVLRTTAPSTVLALGGRSVLADATLAAAVEAAEVGHRQHD